MPPRDNPDRSATETDAAGRALARIKATPRPATAVLVRCRRRGHLLASVHPVGLDHVLVWRRPGRMRGPARDTDEWQRHGGATPGLDRAGWGKVDESGHLVDADDPSGLFGAAPFLACQCGRVAVDASLVDQVAAALTAWRASSAGPRPARPRTITL